MKKIPKSERGFTLIELIIVVGIVGLLASIAIPTFLGYQAKSKQAEVTANLRGIFSAETTYFTEAGYYGNTFTSIGYPVAGRPVYYDFTLDTPAGTPPALSWSPNAWIGKSGLPGDGPPVGSIINISDPGALPGVSQLSFTCLAAGNIDNDATDDTWTINDNMEMVHQWNDLAD